MIVLRSLLVFIALETFTVFSADPSLCDEQQTIFDDCSLKLQSVLLYEGQNVDRMCTEIVNFLSCVQISNITCADLPILKDQSFKSSVTNMYVQVNNYCPGIHLAIGECTSDSVDQSVKRCTEILNRVQLDQSNEQLCSISKEYVDCLNRAVDVCQNSSKFLDHNIPLAVSNTQSLMKGYCEELQGGQPVSGHWPQTAVAPDAVCSISNVNSKLEKCFEYLKQPLEITDISGCRKQQSFLACTDGVFKNCPLVMKMVQPVIDSSRATFETLCQHMICPETIQHGREDIIDYCIKDVTETPPTDSDYCKKMRIAIECIPGVRDVCPPTPYSHRFDGIAQMLQDVLLANCGPVENKRSED